MDYAQRGEIKVLGQGFMYACGGEDRRLWIAPSGARQEEDNSAINENVYTIVRSTCMLHATAFAAAPSYS